MNSVYHVYGCGKCEKSYKGDLIEVLKKIPNNKYVIFESCVLEVMKNKKKQ